MSKNDALLAIGGAALACHLIFKKWEFTYIPAVTTLLLLVPLALSGLLVPHYGVLLAAPVAFAIYYGVMLTSIALYRLSPWHPLANYPGPLPARLSKWWMVWQERDGQQHKYIQALHDRYGDIVRIGPNEVSLRNVDAVAPLMGTNGLPKGPAIRGQGLEPPVTGLIGIRDPAEHARRRRPWTRAFSTAALKEYEPIIIKRITQLSDQLLSQKGTLNLATWFSWFTYDIMGDMVFGGGSEMLANGDQDGVWTMFKEGGEGQMMYHHIPWLAHYAKRLPMSPALKKMRAFALGRTADRYKKGATTKDLFYYLSNEDGAEKVNPPARQVISDGVLATIAASDTTSTTISNAFWNILRYPHYYKRLQAEVDKYYPQGENAFDTTHHPKMTFLEAVLNETLRLYPVLPSGSQRAPIPSKGDRVVGPYFIPDGTQARVHFWSLHRDPRYFSHPDTFWPERWLIAEGLEAAPAGEAFVHNANAYIPFSFGPSNCVGKNLAQMEMRMAACYLLQNLEFALDPRWDPAARERSTVDQFVLVMREGVPVTVQRRN
ncbi:cytochrome P450 [Phanerochaete sordida]|uniref:Cytochrome P450 n=1 Tax=Phanerochaete sordida TaxID=48140 RepID=A0A9P3GGL5_9APHY|nr:cytochrome P450 [Phanerochaete sordida]